MLEYWEWVRENKPELVPPLWYIELVLGGDPNGRPVNTSEHKDCVGPVEVDVSRHNHVYFRSPTIDPSAPPAPLPHCLRITGAMTTPIASLSVAASAAVLQKIRNGKVVITWGPSPLQMLDLLDVLTRPGYAAKRWPKVVGADRWARCWGHEALNSMPHGNRTLYELGRLGILRYATVGNAKLYMLEERCDTLHRFGELFGFTVG